MKAQEIIDNLVTEIHPRAVKWNEERGLLDEFNPDLEISLLSEEYNEFNNASDIVDMIDAQLDLEIVFSGTVSKWQRSGKRNRKFPSEVISFYDGCILHLHEMVDHHLKTHYGFPYKRIKEDCFHVIMEANETKSKEKNAEGKIVKPANFVGPEARIREIIERADKEAISHDLADDDEEECGL